MSDTGTVTPPATGVWYDVDDTEAAVLHELRLQGGDIDADRIRALIVVAGVHVDAFVDGVTVILGPPPDADYQFALEQYTIDLYRSDRPNDQFAFPVEGSVLRSRLKHLIGHRRSRFGAA